MLKQSHSINSIWQQHNKMATCVMYTHSWDAKKNISAAIRLYKIIQFDGDEQ